MTTNEPILSCETILMIQTFRAANPDQRDRKLSAAEFLRKNVHRIRGVGQVLELYGLAEQDNQSAIGWRPTQRMVSLIVNLPGR
jgi:hypothetical protein